jgi:hypothetical protein
MQTVDTDNQVIAVLGNLKDPDKLIHAAEAVRDSGYKDFDIHTPYPVHGLDKAMGIKKTILPKISLGAALFGLTNGVFVQYWTGAVDYKLNIGGKPFFAVEFGVPVMFELTILLCGVTTVLAMFGVLCKLPKWWSEYQHDEGFRAAVDDTFVICLEAKDPRFTVETAKGLLEKVGAEDVRVVERSPENHQ